MDLSITRRNPTTGNGDPPRKPNQVPSDLVDEQDNAPDDQPQEPAK